MLDLQLVDPSSENKKQKVQSALRCSPALTDKKQAEFLTVCRVLSFGKVGLEAHVVGEAADDPKGAI